MRKRFTTRQIIIRDCHEQNDSFWKLFRIFQITICPGMSYKLFEAYYKSGRLDYINVSFFYTTSGEMAGFCAAAFYKTVVNAREIIIARSATGFLQQYQGSALGKWGLYSKYMRYKLRHPFRRMILTIYASNPFIYSMVCKYTGIVYPRGNRPVPAGIVSIKNALLTTNNLQKREQSPFVVRINFEVEKGEEFKNKVKESSNVYVQFFVAQTGLRHRVTLLLIIPVSFINIAWCVWLIAKYSLPGKKGFYRKNLQPVFAKCTYLLNLFSRYFTISKSPYANRKGM